jgi:hypothetical protein
MPSKYLKSVRSITRRAAESALDLHQIIHQALRKRLKVQGRFIQWTHRIIIQLLRVFPDDDYSNRSKWRRLLPHVQYALSYNPVDDDDEGRLHLASRCAMTLHIDGRYKESEVLEVQVMQTKKRLLGNEHPSTLTSTHNLAFMLQAQARHDEALALMERCFQLRQQVLGRHHHDTQSSLNALSS